MKHPNEKIIKDLIDYTVKKSGGERTGCFIVKGDKIISKAISTVEKYKDPTAHGAPIVLSVREYDKLEFYPVVLFFYRYSK